MAKDKVIKQSGKDTGDSRKLRLHGSGHKREHFKGDARAAAWSRVDVKRNRRP